MKKKKNKDIILKPYCYRCGSYEVSVLSKGEIVCHNPLCMCVSKFNEETNELSIRFKVEEK